MEEKNCNIFSPQQVHDLHVHSIPGTQKNDKFIMEHLNDPNFNLA